MQILKYLKILIIISGMTACNVGENAKPVENSMQSESRKEPLRFGMVIGLKRERANYYKQLHANTWPGVLKRINESNIKNYSIYLYEIDGKYHLFSYYEYHGADYAADMKKMAEDSVTQRWWRETDPCQIPLPEASALKKIWTPMEEVFHAE